MHRAPPAPFGVRFATILTADDGSPPVVFLITIAILVFIAFVVWTVYKRRQDY